MPTIGLSYFCRSNVYAELNDFPLAIAFADKAMEISYKINDRLSIADIYRVKGIIQRKLENKELSENYLQTSLRMNKELDNKFNQAETSFELGLLYKEWKKKEESKRHLGDALRYKKKIHANREIEKIQLVLDEIRSM
jgi:tetratricopeptide (TPR) repeat protein